MEATVNAERNAMQLAGKTIEVFMLPNGEFRYSQTSVAKALEKDPSDAGKFFTSNTAKSLLGERLTLGSLVKVGRTKVKGLTDIEASTYWQWKAENGNIEAKALMAALATEALHRRACDAFGVKLTSEQLEQRTTNTREELIAKFNQLNFELSCIPRFNPTEEEQALASELSVKYSEVSDQLTQAERQSNINTWIADNDRARVIRLSREADLLPEYVSLFNQVIAQM